MTTKITLKTSTKTITMTLMRTNLRSRFVISGEFCTLAMLDCIFQPVIEGGGIISKSECCLSLPSLKMPNIVT